MTSLEILQKVVRFALLFHTSGFCEISKLFAVVSPADLAAPYSSPKCFIPLFALQEVTN